jgi:trehalose-6-phosphate synthase
MVLVTEFKYLEITLTRDGSMLTATKKMADNFRSAIARVYRIDDSKGIKQRKHAMLWLFQVFALTCQLVCMVVKYGPLLL